MRVDPEIRLENLDDRDPLAASSLSLLCREAIDAGETTLAVEVVRLQSRESPQGRAVLAAIEATAAQDEDRWHDALAIAVEHDLRLVGVDALEGIAGVAAAGEAWAECLRLASAARRLRDETGYRWRFRFEQERIDAAIASATQALGSEAADAAEAEGAALDWREAASYAARARGERKRPSHGWAALTPTEQQVVALVAEGLTNPQIAERLLMGRATVKTHLDHVFAKTGLHTRTELAAEYVRGSSDLAVRAPDLSLLPDLPEAVLASDAAIVSEGPEIAAAHVDLLTVDRGSSDRPLGNGATSAGEVVAVVVAHVRDALESRHEPAAHLVLADESSPPRLPSARRLEDAIIGEVRHDRIEVVTVESVHDLVQCLQVLVAHLSILPG